MPYYARWYRFLLFWPGSDGLMPSLVIDPEWPHPERSVNAAERRSCARSFTQYMAQQIGDDPELLAKVMPTYPPFGKRMLQDNGSWLATLKRDNVELVTERDRGDHAAAACAAPTAREHAVDVIVFATGFHANRFLWPMEIVGRDGVTLRERWGEEPRAYLGITVPGFPEPVLPLRAGHQPRARRQHHLPLRVPGALRDGLPAGAAARAASAAMECRQEVHDAYNERFDALPRDAGLVPSRHEQLVQERKRSRDHDLAVAAGRLLALDEGAGARGLRAALACALEMDHGS